MKSTARSVSGVLVPSRAFHKNTPALLCSRMQSVSWKSASATARQTKVSGCRLQIPLGPAMCDALPVPEVLFSFQALSFLASPESGGGHLEEMGEVLRHIEATGLRELASTPGLGLEIEQPSSST